MGQYKVKVSPLISQGRSTGLAKLVPGVNEERRLAREEAMADVASHPALCLKHRIFKMKSPNPGRFRQLLKNAIGTWK